MNYASRLKTIRASVSGHRDNLYSVLADIYAWRVEAMVDVADDEGDVAVGFADKAWNEWATKAYKTCGWKATKATRRNAFTQAVRLAFPFFDDTTFDVDVDRKGARSFFGSTFAATHLGFGHAADHLRGLGLSFGLGGC